MEQTVAVRGLNNNQLKILAMVSMLLDHVGLQLFPQIPLLRILGRLALPIFAYMIAEGCTYTRKRWDYFAKIALLAVGCQVVYAVVDGSWYMSILITFSLSILTIYAIDGYGKRRNGASFGVMALAIAAVLFLTMAAPVLLKEQGFYIDYGLPGVALPVLVYLGRNRWEKLLAAAVALVALGFTMGGIFWYSLLALPLLLCYNGQRGKAKLKYLFYIFYPTHLAVIYLLSMLL